MPEYRVGRFREGYCVTWPDPTIPAGRRRYQLKATTVTEAHAEARQVVRKLTQPGKLGTVREVWEAYREDHAGRPVAKTMAYVGKAILAHFGASDPLTITALDCRAYTAARRAQGRHDGAIWTELGLLRTALVWAAKPGRRLIAEAVEIERPQKPDPRDRWLTRAEIDKLLAAAMPAAKSTRSQVSSRIAPTRPAVASIRTIASLTCGVACSGSSVASRSSTISFGGRAWASRKRSTNSASTAAPSWAIRR